MRAGDGPLNAVLLHGCTQGMSDAYILQSLANGTYTFVTTRQPNYTIQYYLDLNYVYVDTNETSSGSGSLSKGGPIAAIVVPTVAAIALIIVFFQFRARANHRGILGQVLPPGVGADTTILVTGGPLHPVCLA